MSLKSFNNIIRACFFTPNTDPGDWGICWNLSGVPGSAKTSAAIAFAKQFGVRSFIANPFQMGEGFFGCTPAMVNGYLDFPPPAWVKPFQDEGRGLVIIDEGNHLGLLGAIQSIVLGKKVGLTQLPGGVRTGFTMNPPNVSTNGCELTLPAANRMMTLAYTPPTLDEHREYLQSLVGGHRPEYDVIDVANEEARVEAAFPAAFAKYVGMETSFLASFPSMKNKDLTTPDPANSKGWYSDRACESAVRFLASAEIQKLDDHDTELGLEGLVGKEWTEKFTTFKEHIDMPNIPDFLDKKVQWKHNPKRLDRTHAVLAGAVTLLNDIKHEKWKDRVRNLWEHMAEIAKDSKDVLVEPVLVLSRMGTHLMPEARPVVNAMGGAFKALNSIK